MSIGSLVLNVRKKYGHGLKVAHYRDVVRLRILDTRPIDNAVDTTCEIHVLTSSKDWLNLMWALKSFYWASEKCYALCIHDDGTLATEQKETLQQHFPKSRVIDRQAADAYVLESLTTYSNCLEFRKTNPLSPKVFDFSAYLRSDRMLLLDSDVLFFENPTALINRIEDPSYKLNTVNGDAASAFTVEPAIVKAQCGFDVLERFNSGLGLIHKASVDLSWIEDFLSLPGIIGHFWRIEQTLYALFSSKYGAELLPSIYDVHLEGDISGAPVRHYVGAIRHLMYGEGIQHLVKRGFLKDFA
ncbi:hypothetical protein [cf. Phormidesmis sp. LEGE 11477]|uniref:hypothetical protein n=1 Tax=cf. Phormidesmis sp. LEGE 11477 TaxID=1828680 RepID=UPI001882A65A|nr:hypothetical protein [cf. Phormidesmis sp. LEGE 11477]MBE9061360.1 hypothetical protein [cf. Phormidesmis sp. LEGE 11477]